jgi:endonuclease/exonuclease/phosphatase family metal-dependent hydrolase
MADSPAARRARVMTYNVHGFIGTDSVFDPERIVRVIEAGEPDLVALQEVELGRNGADRSALFDWLGARLGMRCHFTATRHGLRGGEFGNAVLSRHDFELVSEGTLPRRGGEPRAVQWLKVRAPGRDFHLMNVHLSPWLWERRPQVHALLGTEWLIRAGSALPLVVCGDFNMSPITLVYRRLARTMLDAQTAKGAATPTWPSAYPLLRIDHLFVSRDMSVISCRVLRGGFANRASDHLPILAELEFPIEARSSRAEESA